MRSTTTPRMVDITLEPEESRKKYDTGRFGRGCLLARRLVEAGTRFVEVTTEYVPFFQWDTHKDGHTTVDAMHKEIDALAIAVNKDDAQGICDNILSEADVKYMNKQGKCFEVIKRLFAYYAGYKITTKEVKINGNMSSGNRCIMLVSDTFWITGSANLTNFCAPDSDGGMQIGERVATVRLVA